MEDMIPIVALVVLFIGLPWLILHYLTKWKSGRGISQQDEVLLDDLHESGMLDNTLVVMAGEFGRTPHISHIAQNIYNYPGRDHWAPLQSVWFAGGGVRGGAVIGESDRNGAYPISGMQTPENFAATIYHALGIPREAAWYDATGRPYHVYQGDPIEGLFG